MFFFLSKIAKKYFPRIYFVHHMVTLSHTELLIYRATLRLFRVRSFTFTIREFISRIFNPGIRSRDRFLKSEFSLHLDVLLCKNKLHGATSKA